MYTKINDTSSSGLLFLNHVTFMLIIQKLDDWHPAIPVVDIITKAWGINDSQLDLEVLFFQLGLGDLNLHGLVDLL